MKYILLLVFGLILNACSSSFFDVDDTSYLNENRKDEMSNEASGKQKAALANAALDGIPSLLIKWDLEGNSRHDYFGLKSIHLATDLTSEDMVQSVHHHFGYDYNMDNRGATYARTKYMWLLFYKVISGSNKVLEDYFEGEVTGAEAKAAKARALGLRGFAYYYLINLYQQTYKGNEDALGVPLVLKTTDSNMPRAKVKDVYTQIVNDLTYAVRNGEVTPSKKDVDQKVAAVFLAKAYAHMEVWDSVKYYAAIAAENTADGTYPLNITSEDWLWAYDINATTTTLYASFYSHIDPTIDGYAGALGVYKCMHNKLYEKIAMDDSRKKLYIDTTLFPSLAEKYGFDANWVSVKYASPRDFSGDYCFVRATDAQLLHVEALIELNELAAAKDALKAFVTARQPSFNVDVLTSQSALRETLRFQRRVELWGEGTAFFDFKRWKMGVTRNVVGTNHRTKVDFPAGDKVFIYQISQAEVDANPELGAQNP